MKAPEVVAYIFAFFIGWNLWTYTHKESLKCTVTVKELGDYTEISAQPTKTPGDIPVSFIVPTKGLR